VIDSIHGDSGPWWYRVAYEGGRTSNLERNAVRMGEYLYKPGSILVLKKIPYSSYGELMKAFRKSERSRTPGNAVASARLFIRC